MTSSAGIPSTRGRGRVRLWSAVSTAVFSIALVAAMLPTAAFAVGTVPPPPTGVAGVAGNGTVAVSWTAPSSDGGSALTGYTVIASPGGTTCSTGASTLTCNITGTNGIAYTFVVKAKNVNGSSAASAPSSPVTPGTVPGAPGVATPSGTGVTGQASVSWPAPASSGGAPITGYTVKTYIVAALQTQTCTTSGATTCVVYGLSAASTYNFRVVATNAIGNSALSAAATAPSDFITPGATPGTPTITAFSVGDGQAGLTWTAPAAVTGAPVTGYTVKASPGGESVTVGASATTGVVTGLTNGVAYALIVFATNANGNGTATSATSLTPGVVPGVPSGVTLAGTATSGELKVTWVDPASNGGSAITGYKATASNGAFCPASGQTSTTCTITSGVTDGASYTATVHAINLIGNSAESAPSSSASPSTVPTAPTAVVATVTGTSGQLKVAWQASTGSGGSPISSYTVKETSPGSTATCSSSSNNWCFVNGLTDGLSGGYKFVVTATNAVGTSPASTAMSAGVAPSTTPGAPTALTVSAVSGTAATLSWTAPTSNGSSSLTGYLISATPAATIAQPSGTATTGSVSGLSAGSSYSFTVHAINGNGNSAESAAVTVTPSATTPSAPQALTAAPVSTKVTVGWAAPTVVASGITGYVVTVTPSVTGSPFTITGASTFTKQVTGLTDPTSYTFSVAAKTATTTGPAATIVQKAGALPAAPTVPSSGLTFLAFTGSMIGTLRVSGWTAPSGSLTGYTVKATATNSSIAVQTGTCSSNVSNATCDITGLSLGSLYNVQITATNAIGTGPASALDTTTPANTQKAIPTTAPGAPTGVTATSNDNGQSTVSFTAPTSDGGTAITNYIVTATTVSTPTATVSGTFPAPGTSHVLTGLTNGTAYTFTVQAKNGSSPSIGPSSSASAAATPAGLPAAPTAVTGVIGNGQVTVSWAAPGATGGSAIVGYLVTASAGNAGCTTTGATTCTVGGLVNGVGYTFTVRAQNGSISGTPAGLGLASVASTTKTPADVPGAPTNVVGTASSGQIAVTWKAPSSNGSTPIILYTVTAAPGGASCVTTGTTSASCNVTGLTNGTSYTITVTATNAAGISPASVATAALTPRAGAALDTTVNNSFGDIAGLSAEAQTAIAALDNLNITHGTTTTTYSPAASVTREQMALFISRSITAVGQPLNTTVNNSFGDIAGLGAESQDAIAALDNLNITHGTTTTTYSPAASVTREQMAAFMGRTWVALGGVCDSTVNHSFGDLNGGYADAWIACIQNLGIAQGTSATTFSPNSVVTREQMALFLFRLVDQAVAVGL